MRDAPVSSEVESHVRRGMEAGGPLIISRNIKIWKTARYGGKMWVPYSGGLVNI